MAALGKSLVFYLKYWTEMARLCESEDGDPENPKKKLEGLPDPEATLDMAQQVGAKANRQAADFLEACTPELERHLKSIGQYRRRTPPKIVLRNWTIEFNIWPKYKRSPARVNMTAGIAIDRLDKPCIIPWIWRRGGEEAEKTLVHILGNRAKVRSRDGGWNPGSIGLDRIAMIPDNLDGFDVDREPLLEKVQQAFRAFVTEDLDALWPK